MLGGTDAVGRYIIPLRAVAARRAHAAQGQLCAHGDCHFADAAISLANAGIGHGLVVAVQELVPMSGVGELETRIVGQGMVDGAQSRQQDGGVALVQVRPEGGVSKAWVDGLVMPPPRSG
jgi:hypothetical protein